MYRLLLLILAWGFFFPAVALLHRFTLALQAEEQSASATQRSRPQTDQTLRVFVQGPDGTPVDQLARVILTNLQGQVQETSTQGGYAEFTHVPEGRYDVEVIVPGYERAKEQTELTGPGLRGFTVTIKPVSHTQLAIAGPVPPILVPKAKKELARALEAMRTGKLPAARSHLDTAYRMAPGNPDVNYVFGIYSIKTSEWTKAEDYLEKVLTWNPAHVDALRSLGIVLLQENSPVEAVPYLKRAIEAEPTSWRVHALLAEVYLRLGSADESVSQAERALELGHEQAAIVAPLLARALARRGDTERAILTLQTYLQGHPLDTQATKQLEELQLVRGSEVTGDAQAADAKLPLATPSVLTAVTPFLPSGWLPPDVDERIPPWSLVLPVLSRKSCRTQVSECRSL